MGHTYSQLFVHGVFSTKDREPLIRPEFRQRLWSYMAGIANHEFGHAIRIGGTADHVHALCRINASVSVSDAMRKIKSLSSGWVHDTLPELAHFAWQGGYAAFSVSASAADAVAAYIENQEEHHRHRSFREELIGLLVKHGVEYDPQRVFE